MTLILPNLLPEGNGFFVPRVHDKREQKRGEQKG
jgi:hypothetical protein